MKFRNKPRSIRWGLIGSVVFPFFYIIPLAISGDFDFIIFILGPFSIPIWIVQWVAFLIGGWILAAIATILLFSLVGYLLGRLVHYIAKKTKLIK